MLSKTWGKVVLGLTFAATCAMAQAPADVRIALVIGNGAYERATPLANPANDAAAMEATLKALGFDVVPVRDASLAQMKAAVEAVRARLQGKQAIGVLYYAGHGLQLDFRNFMVPVDARLTSAADVPDEALDVSAIVEAFKAAGNRMNILVLDACRDNPFGASASGKGLAPMDAPNGTFLAYATAPGNVADDGDESLGNGLYTGFLVRELQKPAARIEDVFKRVRLQVRQKSGGRQIPWESTSLEEDFYFNDGVKHTFRPENLQRVSQAAAARQEQLRQQAEKAQDAQARQAAAQSLEAFLAAEMQRLQELQASLQQARESERIRALPEEAAREAAFRAEKAEWDRIKESRKPEELYAFLKRHPTGSMSELAQFELDRLQEAAVRPQPGRDGVVPLASGKRRFYQGDEIDYEFLDRKTGRTGSDREVVTRADEHRVEINGGKEVLDQMGSKMRDRWGSYDPPLLLAPAELALGRKWKSTVEMTPTNGPRVLATVHNEVQALEEVTVPAGKFKAFRITSRRQLGDLQVRETRWIAPELMWTVRIDRTEYRGGSIQRDLSLSVKSFKRAPRPA